MSDAKNWVVLIILINLLTLPIMWLRQGNANPQVLGVSEKVSSDKETSVNSSSSLLSELNKSLWGDPSSNQNKKSTVIDTSQYSLDLPTRNTIKITNPESGIKNTLKSITNNTLQGKLILREGFKSNLAVKDAEIGDKVKIVCDQKELVYNVDSTVLTPDGVVAIVNYQVFSLLGGDINQSKELNCNISKV